MESGRKEDVSSSSLSVVNFPPLDLLKSSSDDVNNDIQASSSNRRGSVSLAVSSKNEASSDLDFVGTSSAVKDLFSLPYSSKKTISVGIHNVHGTLLIAEDSGYDASSFSTSPKSISEEHQQDPPQRRRRRKRTSARAAFNAEDTFSSQTSSLSPLVTSAVSADSTQSQALATISSLLLERSSNPLEDRTESFPSKSVIVEDSRGGLAQMSDSRQYLKWNFSDMKLLVGSDSLIYKASQDESGFIPASLTVRVEDAAQMREQLACHEQMVQSGQFIPDHKFPQWEQVGKQSYAEALTKRQQMDNKQQYPPQQLETKKMEESNIVPSDDTPSFSVPDLDRLQLQTCIVSSALSPPRPTAMQSSSLSQTAQDGGPSPVCTAIDAYLDNIMANVPQLALCLREKGFVQSVKLLQTEHIPSGFMRSSTFDTSIPFDVVRGATGKINSEEQIFDPHIMEMNASTLLRCLKANCSKDNGTFLLRREAGQTDIQLYDVSAISAQRQRKWIWWLAMMSYRFALRLRHLSYHGDDNSFSTPTLRRKFRARQRSLLENTIALLQDLVDMDGPCHETLVAEVYGQLADTFLAGGAGEESMEATTDSIPETNTTKQPQPACESEQNQPTYIAPTVSSHMHYNHVPPDALNKAQDHLMKGISVLWRVWEQATKSSANRAQNRKNSMDQSSDQKVVSVCTDSNSSEEEESKTDSTLSVKTEAVAIQLLGLHDKVINISLKLAQIHLDNYFSSSAMQAIRISARRMADSVRLLKPLAESDYDDEERMLEWVNGLQSQHTRLWELCGHFARSFARDEHWRDRGHACGDDIISVLQDAVAALDSVSCMVGEQGPYPVSLFHVSFDPLSKKTNGMVSLHSLSAVVDHQMYTKQTTSRFGEEELDIARKFLRSRHQLLRDKRKVLVAACVAYSRAIASYQDMESQTRTQEAPAAKQSRSQETESDNVALNPLWQRLGDACNETGKMMLTELRSLLVEGNSEEKRRNAKRAAEPLVSSAEFWFHEGLFAFEKCNDLRNRALLLCNLCQCYKLRANSQFDSIPATAESDGNSHAEVCLQEAANYLQAAHEALGQRDSDPRTWDMVSEELAATFLVLGVRRRQMLLGGGTTPLLLQALRLSPGKERSIVDPMIKGLEIYEQAGNAHQAAAVHYQLAQFYSKVWTCQRDEAKTREKLAAAFRHYHAAHSYFSSFLKGNEATFVLLCLDLASLYAAVSGEECLIKALLCCLDTCEAFSKETLDRSWSILATEGRHEWLEKMTTLATSIEDRVFKLLRSLVKLEEAGGESSKYKALYRAGLTEKMTPLKAVDGAGSNPTDGLIVVHNIVTAVQKEFAKLKHVRL